MATKPKDYLVEKSNALIYASYSMTLVEQQLLMAVISRINPQDNMSTVLIEISIPEMQDLFYTATDRQNAYRDVEMAANRIFEREVQVGDPDSGKYSRHRWFSDMYFDREEKVVSVIPNRALEPFLLELKSNYTSYRLRHAAQLTSVYAIRIYELIASWYGQNRTFWELTIDELRKTLMLTNKYKQIGQLKERVIETAAQQINESSDFHLDVSYRKHGRTVHSVQFRFNRKDEAVQADAIAKTSRQAKRLHNQTQKQKRLDAEAAAIQQESAKQALAEQKAMLQVAWDKIPLNAIYTDQNGAYWQKQTEDHTIEGLVPIKTSEGNFGGLYPKDYSKREILGFRALEMIAKSELKPTAL